MLIRRQGFPLVCIIMIMIFSD